MAKHALLLGAPPLSYKTRRSSHVLPRCTVAVLQHAAGFCTLLPHLIGIYTPRMARPPSSTGLQRRGSASILRCAAITALVLIVAVGLAVLIIWFVIRPAPLEYLVDDARVRGFNLTGGRLNATFDLSIWADNRNNKVAVYYDAMEVRVVYDDQAVAFAEVPPFFHRHHNATEIRAAAVARSVQLGEATAKELNREREAGKVGVKVELRARLRFRIASFKSKHYTLRVYCSPVDVYLSASRPSGRTDCDVEI